MTKFIDDMPWAKPWPWSKQCKHRLVGQVYRGRCHLAPHGEEVQHCLEYGLVWVRWDNPRVTYQEPQYRKEA